MTTLNLASAVSADQENSINYYSNLGIPEPKFYQQKYSVDVCRYMGTVYTIYLPFPVTQKFLDYVNENYFQAAKDCLNTICIHISSTKTEEEIIESLKKDFDDIIDFLEKHSAYILAEEKRAKAECKYKSTSAFKAYTLALKAEEQARLLL